MPRTSASEFRLSRRGTQCAFQTASDSLVRSDRHVALRMPPNSVVPSRPGRLGNRHARPGRTEGRFPVSSERQIARFEDDSTVASALERSEERYEILASVANDGIWDWDLSTNRIAFSDRWKQLLGYEGDEITDNPNEWFVRVHPQDAEQIQLEISAHLDGSRELFESRHRMLTRTGHTG